MSIKKPYYALPVAPNDEERERIAKGEITVSIRPGHREGYDSGCTLWLCCHIKPWGVAAMIVNKRYTTCREVAVEELKSAGYENRYDMTDGLRKYYPDLMDDSPVTVIRWQNVQGKAVDEYKKSKQDAIAGGDQKGYQSLTDLTRGGITMDI